MKDFRTILKEVMESKSVPARKPVNKKEEYQKYLDSLKRLGYRFTNNKEEEEL